MVMYGISLLLKKCYLKNIKKIQMILQFYMHKKININKKLGM